MHSSFSTPDINRSSASFGKTFLIFKLTTSQAIAAECSYKVDLTLKKLEHQWCWRKQVVCKYFGLIKPKLQSLFVWESFTQLDHNDHLHRLQNHRGFQRKCSGACPWHISLLGWVPLKVTICSSIELCSSGHCLWNISSHGRIFQHSTSSCLFDWSLSLKCKDASRFWKQLCDMLSATMAHLVSSISQHLAKTHAQVEANQYFQLLNSGINIAVICRFVYTVQISLLLQ